MTPMGERPALAEAGGVRRASSNEVGRVTDVLTKAFADESIQKWCMACDDPTLLIGVEFLEAVRLLVGEGFLWVTADLGGAAAWLPPGAGYDDEAIDAVVGPVLAAHGGEPERRTRFWEWVEDHRPAEAHWYLDLVGVDPRRHGAGLGSLLLTEGLRRVDALGGPVFLVTDDRQNAAWYGRHGFVIQSEERAPEAGPRVWFMYRPARGTDR